MFITTLISKIRSQLILLKFDFKKRFLHLSWPQVRGSVNDLQTSEVWDQTFFPNYAEQKLSKGSFTKKDPKRFKVLLNGLKGLGLFSYSSTLISWWTYITAVILWSLNLFKRSIGDGVIYLRGLFILFFFDAMLTDDEPIWEPVEWSLVQSWILFIFAFAWIAENLITSRFASYTGRDKRVWVSWYKTFWLIEGWYLISLGAAALFVITPFYHEVNYMLPLVVSWWNWYSRIFFFKFISIYSLVLYIAYYLQLNLGVFHWRKSLFLILLINIFLSYLLYTHFLMSFFAYFTDPNWYHKSRLVDYIHLSHEPNKWSWGNAKRDHFSYHKSATVFWFKNDGPFASAFLVFHIFFFLILFALYIYWLALFRRVYSIREVSFTYTTYCVSALRQFFYFFLVLYLLVVFSFVVQYWRLPIEYSWLVNITPILTTLQLNVLDYPLFLFSAIFKL